MIDADRLATIETLLRDLGDRLALGTVPPRWLSIKAAAEYSSLSPDSIRQLLSSGKLAAHRPVRGRIVVDRLELDSYVGSATSGVRNGRGARRGAELVKT